MTRCPASCAGDSRAIAPRSAASALSCAAVVTAAGPCTSCAALAALPSAALGLAAGVRAGCELDVASLADGLAWPPEVLWPPDDSQPARTAIAAAAAVAPTRRQSRSVRKADTSVAD